MKIEDIKIGDWIDMHGPTQVTEYHFSKKWRMLINESKPLIMSPTWAKALLHLEVKTGLDACVEMIIKLHKINKL